MERKHLPGSSSRQRYAGSLQRYLRYSTRQGALIRSHGAHRVPWPLYSTWEKSFRTMGHALRSMGETGEWETP